jgi:N-acyl-L-homoserine lactone synthetase
MSYIVDWLVKDHLILVQVSGNLPLEDVEIINAKLTELLRAGQPPVHMLADLKELGRFPFDLISMRRASTYLQEPNLGLIMAYGASSLASSFAQLLTSIVGVKMRFVRSYEQALQALAAEDSRIKALLDEGKIPPER